MIITDKCIGCLTCLEWCPTDAIKQRKVGEHHVYVDKDLCNDCKTCLDCECPVNAIIYEEK